MNAVVAGLPRSWHTAPSITAICCGRGRSSMRVRAWSITCSVWTHTSPSGCHSGSCGQPASACSSGNSFATTPSSIASAKPIDGRGANSSFSISPQTRSDGRSSSGISRHSARVASSRAKLEPRGELHGAQHAQAVVAEGRRIDDAQDAPLEIAAAVERIEVLVGQRIPRDGVDREVAPARGASSIDMSGSPVTTKPRCPRPAFESRRGSETSMSPIL